MERMTALIPERLFRCFGWRPKTTLNQGLSRDYSVGHAGADKRPRRIFFLNTLPKSASRFITDTLREGYRAKFAVTAGGQFPNSVLSRGVLQRLRSGYHVTQEHLFPTKYNRLVLEEQVDRMVLHVRDPRQALLSWMHHLDKQFSENKRVPLQILGVREDYPNLLPREKLDYVIKNHLDYFAGWLAAWRDVLDKGGLAIPVQLTRFEDMKADPLAFFQRIVNFYAWSRRCRL